MSEQHKLSAIESVCIDESSPSSVREEEVSLTSREHLEAILFQFVNLYERWSEDRQVGAKQGADVARLIKAFSVEITRLQEVGGGVSEKIGTIMRSESEKMALKAGQIIADASRKEIGPINLELKETVRNANGTFRQWHDAIVKTRWVTLGIAVLSSVVASLLICWLLIPKPVMPLTEYQMKIYQLGDSFFEIWNQIPKEKKDWFLNTARKKKLSSF